MSRQIISFSWNWNSKLFCKYFTTIRLRNDHKYQVGQSYDIMFCKKELGEGIVRGVSHFKLDALNAYMACIDSGLTVEKCKAMMLTMYKNKNINWQTQELSFILIEMPKKQVIMLPDELFGVYKIEDTPDEAA